MGISELFCTVTFEPLRFSAVLSGDDKKLEAVGATDRWYVTFFYITVMFFVSVCWSLFDHEQKIFNYCVLAIPLFSSKSQYRE